MKITNPTAIESDGWERFGQVCSVGRRSLWVKFNYRSEDDCFRNSESLLSIEICGGREGDDIHYTITHADPAFDMIVDIINMGLFSVGT